MSRKPVPAQAGDKAHIEVVFDKPQLLGRLFGEYDKNLIAIGCVTDFLRTVEHNTRHLLRQRIKVSPELKGFRVRFR